jgi:hypothetical protein
MRDTIDMAREANLYLARENPPYYGTSMDSLKAFEALVRADQDERYKWDIHSCGPTCKRYACVAMREAVEAEREACAKVCEQTDEEFEGPDQWDWHSKDYAAAIRARGNT